MTVRSSSRLSILTGLLAALALVAAGIPNHIMTSWAYSVEKGRIQANRESLAGVEQVSSAFRSIAKVVRPGVVQIIVAPSEKDREHLAANRAREDELRKRFRELQSEQDRDALNDLFAEFQTLQAEREKLEERAQRGTGSGIMFDAEGHILTNNHVVDGRSNIQVRLPDQRTLDARVVGADPKTDLALIKIDAPELHPLTFGNSDEMEVGDWVLAVGAPFGLSQSVTHGIISAKGREVSLGRGIMYRDFLQTDAAINPGNSGGPLVNLRGEVIGVNTAIATETGADNGVAFVRPSNLAVRVANDLKKNGVVTRGWVGVALNELDAKFAALMGAAGASVMVQEVYRDTPAFAAGLQCEDIVVSIDGRPVSSVAQLQLMIADMTPGQQAKLELIRDREKQVLPLTVGKQPENMLAPRMPQAAIAGRSIAPLPFELRTLRGGWVKSDADDDRVAAMIKRVYGDRDGVLIVSLKDDQGASYDVEAGQLIVGVNGDSVRNVTELARAIGKLTGPAIELDVVQRDGTTRKIEVRR